MKTFVQQGETMTMVAPYTVTAGQGMQVGQNFGVALLDAASGTPVEAAQCGVMDITKEPSLAIADGARVYWDNTNRRVTTAAAGNLPIGIASGAAAGAASVARVLVMDSLAATGVIVSRELSLPVAAVANTDFTIALPAGHILAIYERTTTAYGAVTNANLTVGTTVGGGEIVASVDIKAKANRTLTLVDANSDVITPFAGGTVNVRITQVGGNSAVGAGRLIFMIAPTA
jgi:predicted RecA/RadA family phage recombinase